MVRMTIHVPEEALEALNQDAKGFSRELQIAAAVKLYEQKRLSQGCAAKVAGLSRSEFIEALGRYFVSPFQYSAEEVLAGRRRT
ncbi:MAG: UPF0175 family protein [Planctomycetota bacterium]|nr:UPF0175 family protein [Planctomycetaceae bacterium]MDQ3329136.1 UPF0175 family protein [Planctomycetota bacterium]